MNKRDEHYGYYSGTIVDDNEDLDFYEYEPKEKDDVIRTLYDIGAVEIKFDKMDGDDYADTCFFKTGPETDFRKLLLLLLLFDQVNLVKKLRIILECGSIKKDKDEKIQQ